MMTTKPIPSAVDSINPPLPSVEWKDTQELGYDDQPNELPSVCFHCGQADVTLSKCSNCRVAGYCSREHQIADWKHTPGHKLSCQSEYRIYRSYSGLEGNVDSSLACALTLTPHASGYLRAGVEMMLTSDKDKAAVRTEIFGRIRFYACPFAVHKSATLGRGFLFLQSERTLAELSITLPKDTKGYKMPLRSILVHFLTMGEFDSEVCRDDFELTAARSTLRELVENYDEQKELVLLMRFRCGHVAMGVAPLVPDFSICKSLGQSYYGQASEGALQLNLDDI